MKKNVNKKTNKVKSINISIFKEETKRCTTSGHKKLKTQQKFIPVLNSVMFYGTNYP